jgi:hypothetical protein
VLVDTKIVAGYCNFGLDCTRNWNMVPDLYVDASGSDVDGGWNRVSFGTSDPPKIRCVISFAG